MFPKDNYDTPAGFLRLSEAGIIYNELLKLANGLSEKATIFNNTPMHCGLMDAYKHAMAYAEYFNPEKLKLQNPNEKVQDL